MVFRNKLRDNICFERACIQLTLEFKREVSAKNVVYYDVELVRGSPSFLKLLQRCHTLAQDLDRLKNLLALEQVKCQVYARHTRGLLLAAYLIIISRHAHRAKYDDQQVVLSPSASNTNHKCARNTRLLAPAVSRGRKARAVTAVRAGPAHVKRFASR